MARFLLVLLTSIGLALPSSSLADVAPNGAVNPRENAGFGPGSVQKISTPTFAEFKQLAADLAPKVNLFRDAWRLDPNAEFFGGTSRDFLYWLKGRFREAKSREDVESIKRELLARPVIDVREFILFESDVDVVSKSRLAIDAATYGLKKIDTISSERFDRTTEAGRNEFNQGFIPAEKIRLGSKGLIANPDYGDGAREIFESKLSVRFADERTFWETDFAKKGLNHPVLLALRYLRLVAVDYFQSEGDGLPKEGRLLSRITSADQAKLLEVIDSALVDPKLVKFLQNEKFAGWMKGTAKKAFRSYTNPNAARLLFEKFHADQLSRIAGGLDPINHTLFTARRDHSAIATNFRSYGVDESKFLVPVAKAFPDGKIYHGTRSEQDFRSIIFQGIKSSEIGSAGAGLYGVNFETIDFAVDWSKTRDLVVSIAVARDARIADISSGYGKTIYERFLKRTTQTHDMESAFATAFGVDILKYPYSVPAFVVKNGGVLTRADGLERKLMTIDKILETVRDPSRTPQLIDVLKMSRLNGLSAVELDLVLSEPRVKRQLEDLESRPLAEIAAIEDKEIREMILRRPAIKESIKRELRETLKTSTWETMKSDFSSASQRMIGLGLDRDLVSNALREIVDGRVSSLALGELRKTFVSAVKAGNGVVASASLGELAKRGGADSFASLLAGQSFELRMIQFNLTQELFFYEGTFTTERGPAPPRTPILTVGMLKELLATDPSLVQHLVRHPGYADEPGARELLEAEILKQGVETTFARTFAYGRPAKWDWVMTILNAHLMKKTNWNFAAGGSHLPDVRYLTSFIYNAAKSAPEHERDKIVRHAYSLAQDLGSKKQMYREAWIQLVVGLLISQRATTLEIYEDVLRDATELSKQWFTTSSSTNGLDGEVENSLNADKLKRLIKKSKSQAPAKSRVQALLQRMAPRATKTCNALFVK